MCDLIVVGGSAVGLFLAKEFAKKGKSVLVLERKKEIGQKLCSGLVSFNISDYVPEKDFRFFLEKEINKANLWIEKKKFSFSGKAFLFDREKFDKYLAKEAENLGVRILLGKNVIGIQEKKDFVELNVSSGEFFRSKLVAGCDGAVSSLARRLNLPAQEKLLLGVISLQKIKKENKEKSVDLFFSKKFSGFFAWRIPRKNFIEWGIALKKKKNPRKKLEDFLKKQGIELRNPKAALIPYFPLKKITSKRVFLCGDSAGQIKPYTGGGIIYGFKCARIASSIISDFKNPEIDRYEKEWRKSLTKEIYLGNVLRKSYCLPNFMKKIGLYFLKRKKRLDQDKPSSIF